MLQEYLTAAIANNFTRHVDTNLLHQVGLGANHAGLSGLSIQALAAQLSHPYAAAAAAALASRGPNIISTNATSIPYNPPLSINQQPSEVPLLTASTRTKSETKDKLAKLSILGKNTHSCLSLDPYKLLSLDRIKIL